MKTLKAAKKQILINHERQSPTKASDIGIELLKQHSPSIEPKQKQSMIFGCFVLVLENMQLLSVTYYSWRYIYKNAYYGYIITIDHPKTSTTK